MQVHDHRTASPTALKPGSIKAVPPSIHDYSGWITPSPLMTYPPQRILRQAQDNIKNARDGKEGQKKTKLYTVVLHPTPMTFFEDMATVASTPISTTGAPRYLHDVSSQQFEAKHLLATAPSLILNPATSLSQAREIAQMLKDPAHSFPFPPRKTRKRNIAELRADETAAAHEERFLLLGNERRYTSARGSRKSPDAAIHDGVDAFAKQSFQKFKAIEQIQLHQKERERWLGQQNEMRQRQIIEARRRGAETRKRPAIARTARQQGNPMFAYNSLTPDPEPNGIPTASQSNSVSATTHPDASGSSSITSGLRRAPLSDQQNSQMLAAQQQQALLQLMRQRGQSGQLNQPPRPQQQQYPRYATQQDNNPSLLAQQNHGTLTKGFKVDNQLPGRQSQANIVQAAQVGHRVQQPRSSNFRPGQQSSPQQMITPYERNYRHSISQALATRAASVPGANPQLIARNLPPVMRQGQLSAMQQLQHQQSVGQQLSLGQQQEHRRQQALREQYIQSQALRQQNAARGGRR